MAAGRRRDGTFHRQSPLRRVAGRRHAHHGYRCGGGGDWHGRGASARLPSGTRLAHPVGARFIAPESFTSRRMIGNSWLCQTIHQRFHTTPDGVWLARKRKGHGGKPIIRPLIVGVGISSSGNGDKLLPTVAVGG